MALKATVYLTALGPQGLKETAELCTRKAHYAAEQLARIDGVRLKFDKPFFKEFTIDVGKETSALLRRLLESGYHAGLALEAWYPQFADCITLAVTEKRTRAEIDGLAASYNAEMQFLSNNASPKRSEPFYASAKQR
jgi:glycine dehydrogenase subunit 1